MGYAALYSSAGNLLSQILVASDTSAVWLLGFAPVGDSTFIACGGERRAGIEHPLLALLHLKASGILERGRTVILRDQIGHFGRVVTLPSSPVDLVFAATFVNGTSRSIDGLRAPWPGFDPVTVEWSHEIVSAVGPWVTLPGLEQAGGNLYVAGTVNDNRKPATSGGRAMDSGLAASYTGSGDLRWLSIVSLTQHSEGFYGIAVGPDAVYGVGQGAEYAVESNGFGYGLISKWISTAARSLRTSCSATITISPCSMRRRGPRAA